MGRRPHDKAPLSPIPLFGLTGGIASGKSTVAAILTKHQVPLVDADLVARDVVAPDSPGLQAIVKSFGKNILLPDASLDREQLGALIFSDNDARERLNTLIHPLIRAQMAQEVSAHASRGSRFVVMDVPLLFETGNPDDYDEILVVYVDKTTQLQRLMKRDGFNRKDAQARLDAQLSMAEKAQRATVLIDNSGARESTERQVMTWLNGLSKK